MNLATHLARSGVTYGDRPAVSLGRDGLWTYRELARRAAGLGAALSRQLGLAPGANVALIMKNSPDYFATLYGVWHGGFAAVPINAKLHVREFAYILENAEARLCFTTPELYDQVAPLAAEIGCLDQVLSTDSDRFQALFDTPPMPVTDVDPDALAWLFYTSGTTGKPKGAMLSHRNLLAMTMNYLADVGDVSERDCMIHAAPLSHGSGLYCLPHVARGANNIVPASGGFEPAETLDLIAQNSGCSLFFAPTMVHRLINDPRLAESDTSGLKLIVYGGGPMYVEDLVKALEVLGDKLVQIYGQGESPMTITYVSQAMHAARDHPRYLDWLGSAGIPRTDVEVRVVDGNDRDVAPGEIGEIVCRGDVVMPGYWNNPEATTAALAGGWLHTGDLGQFDAEGVLTLKDRSKDMIISGGTNIYPREVEEVLLRHPGVAEVSVIGRPHPDWGEEVVAFVVSATQAPSEAALDAHCLDHIARFKRPKAYRFVEALPKNNYGKVLKTDLRAELAKAADER
jgi:long-chain acyl-CoA synthetase